MYWRRSVLYILRQELLLEIEVDSVFNGSVGLHSRRIELFTQFCLRVTPFTMVTQGRRDDRDM